jgi:type I restriction enzyme S subunit
MNKDGLVKHYERVADAPDAITRLRSFILDLAVRGKLVPQDMKDAAASELLKRIAAEKIRLGIKDVVSPLQPDEIPFDLPIGWSWSRIGEICSKTGSGSTPRGGKEVYKASGVAFLRSQNVHDDGLRLSDVAYIDSETHARMAGTKVLPGDLLLNITGGSIGRCCRVPDDFSEANVSQHVAIIRTAIRGSEDFLHRLVLSPYFQAFVVGEQTGAGRGGLPKNRMDQIVVATPPLAEQHRIVAKVNELMALCDQLSAARAEREAARDRLGAGSLARLNTPNSNPATFADDARFVTNNLTAFTTRPDQIKKLRQAILHLAVRGKLMPQTPQDQPAFELLASFAANTGQTSKGRDWTKGLADSKDQAFPTPQGWAWTRIAHTAERVTVGYVGPMKDQYVASGVPFLRSQNVRANRFRGDGLIFISNQFHQKIIKSALAPGDVVVVRSGNVGTACVIPPTIPEGNCSDLVVVKKPTCVMPTYLCFYLNSLAASHVEAGSVGVALTHFNTELVATMPLPLPPLAEQHRIVAKVDELMALCDKLEMSLAVGDETRSRLLDSLLAEALGTDADAEPMEARKVAAYG